jgi:hypothetical protein
MESAFAERFEAGVLADVTLAQLLPGRALAIHACFS